MNKEIKGLERYVSELVLTTLRTLVKKKIKEVVKCLEDIYGRNRLNKLEELVLEWIRFKEDDYRVNPCIITRINTGYSM